MQLALCLCSVGRKPISGRFDQQVGRRGSSNSKPIDRISQCFDLRPLSASVWEICSSWYNRNLLLSCLRLPQKEASLRAVCVIPCPPGIGAHLDGLGEWP